MDVDNYQRAAARTLIDKPDFVLTPEHAQVVIGMIQLGAHMGKIMEYVKKGIFHQHGFDIRELDRLINDIENIQPLAVPLDDDAVMMAWNTIGYIGEACEVAALLEQTILQGKPLDVAELGKELGDGAWYPAALATHAGLRMSDVLAANLDKIRKRYPNGWSAVDSVARVDTHGEGAIWCARCRYPVSQCTCSADSVARVDVAAEPVNHVVIRRDGTVENFDVSRYTATIEYESAVPADYSANLAFDGTVLLDTEGNEPPTIFVPGKPGKLITPDKLTTIINGQHLRIRKVERSSISIGNPICGATKPDHYCEINAEPCDLLCGARICSACAEQGYTTCGACCAGGEDA